MRVALIDFFARSPLLALPVLALVIFIVVYGSVIVRVIWAGARGFDDVARMPLEPEQSQSQSQSQSQRREGSHHE